MNQRIQELLQQSTDDIMGVPIVDQKRFAQLIVRECMSLCKTISDDANAQKNSDFLTKEGKMLYEGVYGGANNCGFAIQEHFGVEK